MTGKTEPLWYLKNLDIPPYEESARDDQCSVKVGLIDTGCDSHHPYLRGSVVDEIDFAASDRGVVYCDDVSFPGTSTSRPFAEIRDSLSDLGVDESESFEGRDADVFERVLSELERQGPLETYPIENPAHFFGSHGTSCAGLVAGAVGRESSRKVIGVFPEAKIVSIGTPFNPEPGPIIRALLYCAVRKVDVILLPRSITKLHDDRESSNGTSPSASGHSKSATEDGGELERDASAPRARTEPRASRLTARTSSTDESRFLEALLRRLAKEIPIVLAAGNGGLAEPEYPGSLATADSSLIVVGAHNSLGMKSAYSSGGEESVTLFGPSDDSETVADRVRRQGGETLSDNRFPLDDSEPSQRPVGLRSLAASARMRDTLAYSTGRAAGDSSPAGSKPGPSTDDEPFQDFGGTSAASSIIAGLAASLQYEVKLEDKESGIKRGLTGKQMKERLTTLYFGNHA